MGFGLKGISYSGYTC